MYAQTNSLAIETFSKFFTPGLIFLLTLATGIWLSHSGKPYSTAVFTLHKLIALTAVVLAARQVYLAIQAAGSLGPQTAVLVGLVFAAGLCVVALFASGALMSIGSVSHRALLTIHQLAPVVLLAALAGAITILAKLAGRLL